MCGPPPLITSIERPCAANESPPPSSETAYGVHHPPDEDAATEPSGHACAGRPAKESDDGGDGADWAIVAAALRGAPGCALSVDWACAVLLAVPGGQPGPGDPLWAAEAAAAAAVPPPEGSVTAVRRRRGSSCAGATHNVCGGEGSYVSSSS